jgi:hypothetical protein
MSDQKRDPATITVVSRLTPATHELFKEYAYTQRRSISKQIRVLIEDAVGTEEEEKAA